MIFGQRLKELRLEKQLTQSELAKLLDVDFTSIANWELSRNETDFATLIKLANFFDVSCDYLLGRVDYQE